MNSLFLCIIGASIGRISDQVRQRPATIFAQTLNFDDRDEEFVRPVAKDLGRS